MEKLKIDDAVISVLKSHKIEIDPTIEIGFRTDLAQALSKVLNQYKFEYEKSVPEARAEVFSDINFKTGCKCPVCDRHVQIRKYTINEAQCLLMMHLDRLHREEFNYKKYFHVEKHIGVPLKVGGDWAKLRHWGLVEECLKAEADNKPRSGYWRLTEVGKLFVQNRISVPKYITLYNAEFRGYKDKLDTISIVDVFDKRKTFDFQEVRQWGYEDWKQNIDNL